MTNVFYQKGATIDVSHEYYKRTFSDELSPGGCYSGLSDQLWTPLALGGSNYIDYTSTMTWPTMADDEDRLYASADNAAKLTMGRTTDTDYLISLGWPARLCPAGYEIMQKVWRLIGGVNPLLRDYTEYGVFDSCDDVTLTVVRFPQISYNNTPNKSQLLSYFQTLDFSIRSGDSGATFSLFPFLSLELLTGTLVDDPPASYGLVMCQTLRLSYWMGDGTRCYVDVDDVPILESTSEWATVPTTITLRLHGPATQPRKATATVSNTWVTESVDLVFNETPLCHCDQGCCVRLNQTPNGIETYSGGGDTDVTPDNILSMAINLA